MKPTAVEGIRTVLAATLGELPVIRGTDVHEHGRSATLPSPQLRRA